ncbi:MAG: PEP-CTERM system histidine kinase PrsK [Acidobacteria bacterium]|nr:PEP-CTERM system histidine kinase PrsK [Acidobacteriota bacterium]
MNGTLYIPIVAALGAGGLAVASVVRKAPSVATWAFALGMLTLAADAAATGLALRAATIGDLVAWLALGMLAKAALPAVWLAFSLTYARADPRASLRASGLPLLLLAIVPIGVLLTAPSSLLAVVPPDETGGRVLLYSGGAGRLFHATILLGFVLALMNLEQTFRASIGTMRWRVKYVVLGLGVIFGAYIFVRIQAILYPTYDPALAGVESSALLVGCVFLVIAYTRDGLGGFDVHPSRAVLRSSVTVLLVGGYLFVVGVLAQAARQFGGGESFQLQAFVVLVGMAGLAVLLLSDRLRQRLHAFVGRHFGKSQHDSTRLWTDLSRNLAAATDERSLCTASATLVANAFEVLSVSIWRTDDARGTLHPVASTASSAATGDAGSVAIAWNRSDALGTMNGPLDLDAASGATADALRTHVPSNFANGGRRWAVPLRSGETTSGFVVLADRVNGAPWTTEERELLQCMADQLAAALDNVRLGDEVARARELDAFRTMSAFFVHDLKNATNSLNLMLKNLPVHFDDPAFRADALRAIGNTVTRIDGMIARLGALRQQPGLQVAPVAPAALVEDAAVELQGSDVALHCAVPADMPMIRGDRDQLVSVVANLLLTARDAIGARAGARPGDGRIDVRSRVDGGRVVLEVEDNGCGMSPAFLRDGLFRPFQSTKSKGLGIGMFQARQVIEQHGGSIHVESQQGIGTTVRISLPVFAEDHAA